MIDREYKGLIQWDCNGLYVFEKPKAVTHFSECGEFCFVEGAVTGIPVAQAIPIEPEPEVKYTFFWRESSPFSQWHLSRFTVARVAFNCAEQYMMASKAAYFKDANALKSIMASKSPQEQKYLGRSVRNFDKDAWNRVSRPYVYRGNYAKFSQNPNLYEAMMATIGTTLVEASPSDYIWGIGLSEEKARKTDPAKWPGTNWLGLELTAVREDLIKAKQGAQ